MQTFNFHAPLFKYLRYTFNLGILILAISLIPACFNLWEEAQREAQSIDVYDFCKPPSHGPNWHPIFFECDPSEKIINQVREARQEKTKPFVARITKLVIVDVVLWIYLIIALIYSISHHFKKRESPIKQ